MILLIDEYVTVFRQKQKRCMRSVSPKQPVSKAVFMCTICTVQICTPIMSRSYANKLCSYAPDFD